jgi:hypothetical protein
MAMCVVNASQSLRNVERKIWCPPLSANLHYLVVKANLMPEVIYTLDKASVRSYKKAKRAKKPAARAPMLAAPVAAAPVYGGKEGVVALPVKLLAGAEAWG